LQRYQNLQNEAKEELSKQEQDRLQRLEETEPGTLKYALASHQLPWDYSKDVYERRQRQRKQNKHQKQKKNKTKRKKRRN